jgi:hypothetical protein
MPVISLFLRAEDDVFSLGQQLASVLKIDCLELSADEKLALASEISDALEGRALALADERLTVDALQPVVSDFISRRKEAEYYSTEVRGETIVVHSADPVAASKRKKENTLPPNLKQCPYCSFITQYEEEYNVHMRAHLFGV